MGKLTVTLGNPFLIFVRSLAMLLLGCAIGLHWKGTSSTACWLTVLGALLMVIHDLGMGVFWFRTAAMMLARNQQRRS